MLHHSNSRQQRNKGSKIKTLLKVTILLAVAIWLVYQVKHSYDKKNEYYNATEDQLSHDDRSMFQGRKERLATYGDGNVEKAIETADVTSKQEEEKGGESVFEKDNADSHDDDAGKTEAEEGQTSRADDNAEAHHNDEDEATGHSAAVKHDAQSNSSDADSKAGDDVPQNNGAQEEIAGEINGEAHEYEAHSNRITNAGQIDASSNGSDRGQADSEPLFDDTKAGTSDEHSGETLPDETGNIPAVHNENPQGDAASSTSDAYGHSNSDTVHVDIGSKHEGAATSSGDAEKGNSVESNPSDSVLVEEKAGTASGGDEKGSETGGTANKASGEKERNPQEGNAATETRTDQAANTQTEDSKGASAAEGANGSLGETKPVENQTDGATKASSNGDQDNIKIETNTSTNDEHNEHQSADASSGSSGSNDSGPEQTGKTEAQ